MTLEQLNWLSTAATLTWIAHSLANSDPCDGSTKLCSFCCTVIGYNSEPQAHTELCAWRVAKELFPDGTVKTDISSVSAGRLGG